MWKKILVILLIVFFTTGLIFYHLLQGTFFYIPTHQDLKRVVLSEASEIYSSDSVLLGRMYTEQRKSITIAQIPQQLLDCLIATEDVRFYHHNGIDFIGLSRVLVKSFLLNEKSGGGSTLTQQLVKNWFPRSNQPHLPLVLQKLKEWIAAYRLEQIKSKSQILQDYLNTVPFGHNTFGIYLAAEYYFNKTPETLAHHQIAMLVGLLKGTTLFDPERNPALCLERRNLVLKNWHQLGGISDDELKIYSEKPLDLATPESKSQVLAPFFTQHIRQMTLEVLRDKSTNKRPPNPYTDGLSIFTTINSRVQMHAEAALKSHLDVLQAKFSAEWSEPRWRKEKSTLIGLLKKYHPKTSVGLIEALETNALLTGKQQEDLAQFKHFLTYLRAGFICINNSGEVLAWVGGRDFNYAQYDHVKSKRQVGSIFKPIVYITAIDQGVNICNYFKNDQLAYNQYDDWSPANASHKYGGYYTMKGALTHSLNVISVQVMFRAGLSDVLNVAAQMGIASNLPQVPSISLGTPDISLFEMVNSCTCFPNAGKRKHTYYLSHINTADGTVLFQDKPDEDREVFSPEVAAIMTNMLQAVVDHGTGTDLRTVHNLKGAIAGKTGTTQNHADGWFVGYTPQITAGAWVGADSPGIHFASLKNGAGSKTALPIWGIFAAKIQGDTALKHLLEGNFAKPSQQALKCLNQPLYLEQIE